MQWQQPLHNTRFFIAFNAGEASNENYLSQKTWVAKLSAPILATAAL